MKIRITSMADEDVAPALRDATTSIEDAAQEFFADKNYEGSVDQFIFVIISLDASVEYINNSCLDFEKTGTYVDPIKNKKVRYVSVSCVLHPIEVLGVSEEVLKRRVFEAMKSRLDSPLNNLPKGFQFSNFASEFRALADQLEELRGK